MKVEEYLKADDGEEPNHKALLNWVNMTFPLGLTPEKAAFETRTIEENGKFLIETVKRGLRAQDRPRGSRRGARPGALHHAQRDRSALAGASLRHGRAARGRLPALDRAEGSARRIQERGLRNVRRADAADEVRDPEQPFPQHVEPEGLRGISRQPAATSARAFLAGGIGDRLHANHRHRVGRRSAAAASGWHRRAASPTAAAARTGPRRPRWCCR